LNELSKVDPQTGENLWGLTKRIGDALDDLSSLAECCCPCDFFITQADIDDGGYTITAPGVYCLAESVELNEGDLVAITIQNTSDVILDLKGHTIDCSDTVDVNVAGIEVENSLNCIIRNGAIKNALGDAIRLTTSVSHSLIHSIDCSNVGCGISVGDANPYTILKSCRVTDMDSSGFFVGGDYTILIDCVAEDGEEEAVGFFVNSDSVGACLKDCKARDLDKGFVVDAGAECVQLSHCAAIGCFIIGFECDGLQVECVACVAQVNAGAGFSIAGSGCILRNCASQANEGAGFSIAGPSCALRDCSVTSGGGTGFLISGAHSMLRGCTASELSSDGFGVSSDYNSLRDCVSSGNADEDDINGFTIAGDKNVIQGCHALDNDQHGFEVSGDDNKIISNCAIGNGDTGFEDDGDDNGFFNNAAHCNDTNFSDIECAVVVSCPEVSSASGFWANIDGFEPGD